MFTILVAAIPSGEVQNISEREKNGEEIVRSRALEGNIPEKERLRVNPITQVPPIML